MSNAAAREILIAGARALAHADGLEPTLQMLLASIGEQLEVASAVITIVTEDPDHLAIVASIGLGETAIAGLAAAVRGPRTRSREPSRLRSRRLTSPRPGRVAPLSGATCPDRQAWRVGCRARRPRPGARSPNRPGDAAARAGGRGPCCRRERTLAHGLGDGRRWASMDPSRRHASHPRQRETAIVPKAWHAGWFRLRRRAESAGALRPKRRYHAGLVDLVT